MKWLENGYDIEWQVEMVRNLEGTYAQEAFSILEYWNSKNAFGILPLSSIIHLVPKGFFQIQIRYVY